MRSNGSVVRLGVALVLASAFLSGCAGGYGGGGGGGGNGSAPAAVTGLAATAGNAQVSLTWNASAGATGYYVKRSTTSGTESKISTQPGTNFTDTGLTNGTKYYYVVSAYNSYGEGANSAEVSATPTAPTAGTAPSALIATPGDSQITLNWNAVTGATSYNVKRSTTSGGPYSTTSGSPSTNMFVDSSVANGTKYFYVVTAVSSAGESGNSPEANATPANTVTADVTITANPGSTTAISPYIYGMNFYNGVTGAPTGLTFDRAGGNRWTAYNWNDNTSNAGSDYIYNTDYYLCSSPCVASTPADSVRLFIAGDQANSMASLVTFQMQGLVATSAHQGSLPPPPNPANFRPTVDKKSTVSAAPFTLNPPPASTDENVYMDEFAWALDQKLSGKNIFGASPTHPTFVSLDNEPELWNSTHQEIQGATMVTSDNYITKTATLTKALKDQFPNMIIFGPVNYGFQGIYKWQSELNPTPSGANWFADKYLTQINTASTTYGKALVDVYDFHWYPEEYDASSLRIIDMKAATLSDAQIQLIVQSPRNLWDSTFNDAANGNSNPWVYNELGGTPINMLGRLQAKINAENPGMKLAVTEYEGGGWNHIAGTVAQADFLGIFGMQGLFAANFWPPSGSFDYALAGFRAFRDFDGAGANFGDVSVKSTSSDASKVMVYTSQDSAAPGRAVFVALNRTNSAQTVIMSGQPLAGLAHIYLMTAGTANGQSTVKPVSMGTMTVGASSLTITLPALSVATIDVK